MQTDSNPIDRFRSTHPAWGEGADEAPWLASLRQRGLGRFEQLGFPGVKNEAWKYTSVKRLTSVPYGHVAAGEAAALDEKLAPHRVAHAAAELVFVNGTLQPGLSRMGDLPRGVTVTSIAEAASGDGRVLRALLGAVAPMGDKPFTALNTAFLQDGALVHLARRVTLDAPIHLLFVSMAVEGPVVSHPRNLFVCEPMASGQIVRTHVGLGSGEALTNAVTEILVRPGGRLSHQVIDQETTSARLVDTTEIRLERDAYIHNHVAWMRCGWVRHDLNVRFSGTGASADLDGVYVLGGRQHVDNHTVLDHASPHCTSREFYKGVLGGQSKGIFDGLVMVRKDAQKTDASQSNKNLLLTDTADANAKPQLEIYADDVKCAHGTTVGQLDKQQLWYLRSRGIPDQDARNMLTSAFVQDRVDTLKDETLRTHLTQLVASRLAEVQEEAQ